MKTVTEKLIVFYSIILLSLAITLANCSSPVETIIDHAAVDSLGSVIDSLELTVDSLQTDIDLFTEAGPDTVLTFAEISLAPTIRGRWGDNFLVAYMTGIGVNRSSEVIKDVSIELTLSSFQFTKGILSETEGFFTLDKVIPQYSPNDPFPYKAEFDLDPGKGYNFYVSSDTVFNTSIIYWSFRLKVRDNLPKRVGEWQYGGIFERNN